MESLFVHPPVMLLIISYLRLLDYIALRRAFPQLISARNGTLYPLPAELLAKVVEKYIDKWGGNHGRGSNSAFACLAREQMFVTGGFLLNCLTETKPTGYSDLDVMCLIDSKTQYQETAESEISGRHFCAIKPPFYQNVLNYDELYLQYLIETREEGYMLVQEFNAYLSKQGDIDYIYHTSVSDMLRHVSLFDFSFCRNIFDLRRKKLVIFDLNSIIKRECVLSIQREYKHFVRCCNPLIKIQKPFGFIDQIRMPRILKYRERGYEIKFDFTNVGNEEFENAWKDYFC